MPETLVIGGGGYVGAVVAQALRANGSSVTTTSRSVGRADLVVATGCALDEVLASGPYDQVVHLPQLTSPEGGLVPRSHRRPALARLLLRDRRSCFGCHSQ